MARPASGRTQRLDVRLTPDEAQALSDRAKSAGYRTVSDYVRAFALAGHTARPARTMAPENAALIRMLSGIGERIAFMAHLSAPFREELRSCLALVQDAIVRLGA